MVKVFQHSAAAATVRLWTENNPPASSWRSMHIIGFFKAKDGLSQWSKHMPWQQMLRGESCGPACIQDVQLHGRLGKMRGINKEQELSLDNNTLFCCIHSAQGPRDLWRGSTVWWENSSPQSFCWFTWVKLFMFVFMWQGITCKPLCNKCGGWGEWSGICDSDTGWGLCWRTASPLTSTHQNWEYINKLQELLWLKSGLTVNSPAIVVHNWSCGATVSLTSVHQGYRTRNPNCFFVIVKFAALEDTENVCMVKSPTSKTCVTLWSSALNRDSNNSLKTIPWKNKHHKPASTWLLQNW